MIHASSYGNLSSVKEYLKVLINFFKSNPYASAKLFHGIATNSFHYRPERVTYGPNKKKSCWQMIYENDDGDTNTNVNWGEFLPERIRKMLLNMSRYFFDNLLTGDSLDATLMNEKFFGAFKIFI